MVGALNADDVKSTYSTAGASLWVVDPCGEDGIEASATITTDQADLHGRYSRWFETALATSHPLNRDGDCFSAFGGTSSAALTMAASYAQESLGAFVESAWFGAGGVEAPERPIPDADGARVSATVEVAGLLGSADIEAVVLKIAAA